jgi:hypothetical protein
VLICDRSVYVSNIALFVHSSFTPDWETSLPPSVRESLDKMSPEDREKWTSRPIAVMHFTDYTASEEKREVEFKPYEMPIAMKHFAPEPKEKKEYVPEPMPAAMYVTKSSCHCTSTSSHLTQLFLTS